MRLTMYVSIFGSSLLMAAAAIGIRRRRVAARLALGGAFAVSSFYLPAFFSAVQVRLSDQELSLLVMRWTPSSSALVIQELEETPGFPDMKWWRIETDKLKAMGLTGRLEIVGDGRYGSGNRSRVILIVQKPAFEAVALKQPDASSIIAIQDGEKWRIVPSDAPMLKRTIRIAPWAEDPMQTFVGVELASGASQGFGILWPKGAAEDAAK